MNHKYTYKKVEEYLLSLPPLKMDDVKVKDTIEEQVLHVMRKCVYKRTIDEQGNTYCPAGKYRSIGDIFRIIRSVKEVSFEDVFKTLVDLVEAHDLDSWVCNDIDQRVYSINKDGYDLWNYADASDEFGFFHNSRASAYTNEDILITL